MKKAAIICEYNPFHSGHEYQIKRLRAQFPEPVAVIAIMSGAFTQRGEPAILDKYARAEAAVRCGVDLVCELPAPWSMSSAQFFAAGGVRIAERLCVDYLAFGSECGDLDALKSASERLASDEFASALESARKSQPELQGGALRTRVYTGLYGELPSGSNDILALEYLTALRNTAIEPIAIKRVGERYNPTETDSGFKSASTVRREIYSGNTELSSLPDASREIILRESISERIYRPTNLDSVVTAFLRFSHESMRGCAEVTSGIENRLHAAAMRESTLDGILEASLERNYSKSRLRRAIFSGILGYRPSDLTEPPEYTSLLAANEVGREILSEIRKSSFILTKPASYTRLPKTAQKQFESSLRADTLAALACDDKSRRDAASALKASPIII